MTENLYNEFQARGLLDNCTDPKVVEEILKSKEPVTAYIGFDCTATSLHCGSLIPIIAMKHMQNAGHRTVALIGGGTTLVGDPSGKTETRQMLNRHEIKNNVSGIKNQIGRMIDTAGQKGTWFDNALWLEPLNYLEFLRDVGKHFSVNRMVSHESVKQRLKREDGLSFIEFNYQLLQAYDFYKLFYGDTKNILPPWRCKMQMGGSDQWGNIVAGIDLIRRKGSEQAYGITFPLLTTASGTKMGKTEAGAIWLDAELTSPYDFFQYWRNTEDADVAKFLKIFTFLPLDEIESVEKISAQALNPWKEKLAFEITSFVHGEAEAKKAVETAKAAFGKGQDLESLPQLEIKKEELEAGIWIVEAFTKLGLAKSNSESRRTITQGGAYVNGNRVDDVDMKLTDSNIEDGQIMMRMGKKKHGRIVIA